MNTSGATRRTGAIRRSDGARNTREKSFAALRLAEVLLLAAAILAPSLPIPAGRTTTVVVVDASASVQEADLASAVEWAGHIASAAGPGDGVAVVAAGAEARLIRPPQAAPAPVPGLSTGELAAYLPRDQTDLEAALRLAAAAGTPGTPMRVVLISDGLQTRGDGLGAARDLARQGIPVHVVPILREPAEEALVEGLQAPASVRQGEPFELWAALSSTAEGAGTVDLLANGELIARRTLALQPPQQVVRFEVSGAVPGATLYEVLLHADRDARPENNRASAVVQVIGPPRVLLVAAQEAAGVGAITGGFAAQGVEVHRIQNPGDLPTAASGLAAYDGVVLVDTPALGLSEGQQEALGRYVRDLGGGLTVLGGPHSFGPGGYFGSRLEEALPVLSDVPERLVLPSLAMVLVIDKSGSMNERQQGASKLELAVQAARAVVDLLQDRDLVGVVAFDAEPRWVVPLQPAANRAQIRARLAQLQADGGTQLYPALVEAHGALAAAEALIRHVVVLSDGISTEGDFEGIVRRLREASASVSSVAIGADADLQLMSNLARWGGGRAYFTDDIRRIPQIFVTEALTVSRKLVVDRTFEPQFETPAPFLVGPGRSPLTEVPPLDGYVVTTPKVTADVHLRSPDGDPILASWRYGLGRVVSFTASLGRPWGQAWLAWPQLPALLYQTVQWTFRAQQSPALTAAVDLSAGNGRISVDAVGPGGEFLNFLELEALVFRGDEEPRRLVLEPQGPGRYGATWPAGEPGAYLVQVRDPNRPELGAAWAMGALPYAPEHARIRPDPALLLRIASLTGGTVLGYIGEPPGALGVEPNAEGLQAEESRAEKGRAEDLRAVLEADRAAQRARSEPVGRLPLWPWLVGAALALLVADVAVRLWPGREAREQSRA